MGSRSSHSIFRRGSSLFVVLTALGGCVFAQQPMPFDRDRLSELYLRQHLTIWQQRLRLQEWRITVDVAPATELRARTLGNIRWDAAGRTAVIRVKNASGYQQPFAAALRDMEITVVHELIHLTLSSLPRNDASRVDEEIAVDRIAEALIGR